MMENLFNEFINLQVIVVVGETYSVRVNKLLEEEEDEISAKPQNSSDSFPVF